MNSTLQLAYPCVWLLGVALPPDYGDNALMPSEGEKLHEYTQQRYVNRLIGVKFSAVHVMASRVVYRFCL